MSHKPIIVLALVLSFSVRVKAQESAAGDTLYPIIEQLNQDISLYKKLKVSGYIQAQYQYADTAGISSFAGGNFPANSNQRFNVRRGRVKFAYGGQSSQFVLQLDLTEKGLAAKDAYGIVTDPWTRAFSLTGGLFNRPFGHEIVYSSSQRESPERSRIYQTLFPGERDAGMMLTFQPPKTSSYNWFKLEAGLFNGTGVASDFDSQKDFIGHLSINRTNKTEVFKYGFGLSYYKGGWRNGDNFHYSNLVDAGSGIMAFAKDSTSEPEIVKREYLGADLQLNFESPLGMTTLRGEYLTGTQPGTLSSNVSPGSQPVEKTTTTANLTTGKVSSTTPNSSAVLRKFAGAVVYLTQNIGETKHQLVAKYDFYDPNTAVQGKEIDVTGIGGSYGKLGSSDVMYSTIGIGYIYKFDSNVKFSLYYDMVKNESTKLAGYTNDLKDNVFTFRVQYKF
ncbi:MAG: hypothetical protein U0T82_03205 [Bacteroidales bacterium]